MKTTLILAGAFNLFMPDFAREYYFSKTSRAIELSNHVRVVEFGRIGQWTSPDAIATYNGVTNTISLHKDYFVNGVVKPASQIMGGTSDYSKISVIFHEMGHAELDVYIENGRENEDMTLKSHYDNKLKDFYKKHFPKFNAKTVFHEHFGYYRSELVEFMANEMYEVLLANAFNKFQNKCYLNGQMKFQLAEGIKLEDFQKLILTSGSDEFYQKKVNPRYVFVKGKDIDLSIAPQDVIQETHHFFWSYHRAFYGFPMNRKELVERMNQTASFRQALKECRTKLFHDFHAGEIELVEL